MAVVIKEGKMVIECHRSKDYEYWLSTRKAIIESMQAQGKDADCRETNYYLLDLLLELEPSSEQAKQLFNE